MSLDSKLAEEIHHEFGRFYYITKVPKQVEDRLAS